MVTLENRAGKFVAPTPESFKASGIHADWKNAPGFYMVLTDQPGDDSWPITGLTYILVQRNQTDAGKAEILQLVLHHRRECGLQAPLCAARRRGGRTGPQGVGRRDPRKRQPRRTLNGKSERTGMPIS